MWLTLASFQQVLDSVLLVIDVGAMVAGPRLGRFDRNGKPRAMPGHNSVFFLTGVLLLW